MDSANAPPAGTSQGALPTLPGLPPQTNPAPKACSDHLWLYPRKFYDAPYLNQQRKAACLECSGKAVFSTSAGLGPNPSQPKPALAPFTVPSHLGFPGFVQSTAAALLAGGQVLTLLAQAVLHAVAGGGRHRLDVG